MSLGAVLAAQISGDDALSGLATAAITLGTALTAVPLAALARARGRRPALATGMTIALAGVGLVLLAASATSFVLLLAGFALIGAGQAANLQSRFAAVDLATDSSRVAHFQEVYTHVKGLTTGLTTGATPPAAPNTSTIGSVILSQSKLRFLRGLRSKAVAGPASMVSSNASVTKILMG